MTTTITTDSNSRIQLPETPRIAGQPWVFDTSENETAILLFLATEPNFGMEYRIWLTDDESQPWSALSCDTFDAKFTDAANVRDTAGSAEDLAAWLRDCADAFSWACTLAAEGQLDELITQQVLPERGETETEDWLRPYETILAAATDELRPALGRHRLTLEMTLGANGALWSLRRGNDIMFDCDSLTSIRAWLRALDAISRR